MMLLKAKIKEALSLKNILDNIQGMVLLGSLLLLSSCITRPRLNGKLWLFRPIPQAICDRNPELRDQGMYRKLDDGNEEFISYCQPKIAKFTAIHKDDLARLLGEQTESERKTEAAKAVDILAP